MIKKITPAKRRHQDELRRQGLTVGAVYENRLVKLRLAEVRRCLELARNFDDEEAIIMCLGRLDESKYLPAWYAGLYKNAGLPMAEATARDLRVAKAGGFVESDAWLDGIASYARQRAGSEIVVVSGTLKDTLVKLTRRLMGEDLGLGVEKLTKRIYKEYQQNLARWQCRRIAQTETMIALGESADLAAQTLDIAFTKQWCISGLGNTRDSHEALDGLIIDQDDLFELKGGRMRFPHDTSLGADASEIINCACACIREPKPVEMPREVEVLDPDEQRIRDLMAEMPDGIAEADKRAIALNDIEMEAALKTTKGAPMSVDEADKLHANPKLMGPSSYRINCQTCSPAYVLRTRGFDVTAGPNTKTNTSGYLSKSSHFWEKWLNADGTQAKHVSLLEWYKKNRTGALSAADLYDFYDQNTKEPGIYEVAVMWLSGGGHSTILQRFDDGKLMRIDAQVGTQAELTKFDDLCSEGRRIPRTECEGVMRVDNKVFAAKFAKIFKKAKK